MFRSKPFTVAFSILSVLIVALIVLFLYLVFGKGKDLLMPVEGQQPIDTVQAEVTDAAVTDPGPATVEPDTETFEETTAETTTEAPTEPLDTSVRALHSDEPHEYPIVGEDIREDGTVTIIKSGDNGEGIVFHAVPAFDAADTPGNVTNYSGTFVVMGKQYILDNGSPFLMYKTLDGYYVTSSEAYIHFDAIKRTISANNAKIADYGKNEGEEIVIRIHHEDGSHLAFSVYNYSPASGELLPALENVVAVYTDNGVANFEYHYSDGEIHHGTIAFEGVTGQEYSHRVDLNFDTPFSFRNSERNEVVLHN